MSAVCVKVDRVCKRFFIPKRQQTFLSAIRSLLWTQAFGDELWVLRDLSFEIYEGEKIAVIGPNGSGKTTLLRIMSGIYLPSSGSITVTIAPRPLFAFVSGLSDDLPVIDNVYLFGAVHGMTRPFLDARIASILKDADLYDVRHAFVKNLSRGQRQRLALSTFFQTTDRFLIFDESFGFMDQAFSRYCALYFEKLARSDRTAIFVSHDTDLLLRYCSKALWLEKGVVRMFGEASIVIKEYQRYGDRAP